MTNFTLPLASFLFELVFNFHSGNYTLPCYLAFKNYFTVSFVKNSLTLRRNVLTPFSALKNQSYCACVYTVCTDILENTFLIMRSAAGYTRHTLYIGKHISHNAVRGRVHKTQAVVELFEVDRL